MEGAGGTEIEVGNTLQTVDSVLYDAVYIPGGQESIERLKLYKAASDLSMKHSDIIKRSEPQAKGSISCCPPPGPTRLHSRALSPLVVIRTKTTSAKAGRSDQRAPPLG
ncbi:hypothetical protein PO124_26395 [Bacillus licheniformis]|nr:hypothetical protein [Bacillus licheniformis]